MFAAFQNQKIDYQRVLLILILGLGFCLRVYELGKDPFWVDEFGVAMAAFQSSIGETITIAQMHIMAMPLDYAVAWFSARFSNDEAVLRFPEAVWGTATLLAGYFLFTELSKRKGTALFATFLLAVSPTLIKYSQELRFYAPLVFFYVFATWLGMLALKRPKFGIWFAYTVTVVIGLFFHFYVLFALCNIGVFYLLTFRKQWFEENRFSYFISSSLIIIVGFIIGLLNFGSVFGNPITLQLYESLDAFLLVGLGWRPPFPGSPITLIWGYLCAVFALLGVFVSLKEGFVSKTSALIYSIVIQICAVIFFDIKKNYFLSARQLLMLVPLVLFYTAYGIRWMIGWAAALRKPKTGLRQNVLWFLTIMVFAIAVIPVVSDYYRYKKSSIDEILYLLSNSWHPEEKIVIVPSYNYELFTYYSQEGFEFSSAMEAMEFDQISPEAFRSKNIKFIIVNYPLENWMESMLEEADFEMVYIPANEFLYPQMVWQRD